MARKSTTETSSANLGFEQKLWLAAAKLRNNMDAAEYKHVVLGLIFLKYISDTCDGHHAKLKEGKGDFNGANPEDKDTARRGSARPPVWRSQIQQDFRLAKDQYLAANAFWVPKEALWAQLQASAKLPSIGKDMDDAMVALENDNPRLGDLIDLIGPIQLADVASRSKDLLVEMLAAYKGRIYNPACGFGGMFGKSDTFVESHGGQLGDISVYGQERSPTTRRLAIMNLALRGIEADFGAKNADTFRRDLHPDLRADYVLATPPSTTPTGSPKTTQMHIFD